MRVFASGVKDEFVQGHGGVGAYGKNRVVTKNQVCGTAIVGVDDFVAVNRVFDGQSSGLGLQHAPNSGDDLIGVADGDLDLPGVRGGLGLCGVRLQCDRSQRGQRHDIANKFTHDD